MEIFFDFFFLLPVTLIALVICGGGVIYFLMGINQLATGYREKDRIKKQGGLIALLISMLVISGILYLYFEYIWPW